MSISLYPAASSSLSVPNWQLVTSNAPTGVATVTFSSLAGYSKYRILFGILSFSAAVLLQLRLNADVGANYYYTTRYLNGATWTGTSTSAANQTLLSASSGATFGPATIDIEGALVLGPKYILANNTYTGSIISDTSAIHLNNSAVTSITLFLSSGTFTGGTIYLYGAN